jgi:hypothetical protein
MVVVVLSAHLAIISFESHPSLSPAPFRQHLPGDCIAETDVVSNRMVNIIKKTLVAGVWSKQ